MSKYNAKSIVVDGFTFDSEMESRFYLFLKQQRLNGVIHDFQMQPRFELIPAFEKFGEKQRKIEYVADFIIYHNNGNNEVVDVKGFETKDFLIKKKLFNYKYPEYKLSLVTECPRKYGGGWIQLDDLNKLRAKAKKELAKKLAQAGCRDGRR